MFRAKVVQQKKINDTSQLTRVFAKRTHASLPTYYTHMWGGLFGGKKEADKAPEGKAAKEKPKKKGWFGR